MSGAARRPVTLTVQDLRVDYPTTTAVAGVSLTVEAGTVYGLIGPNGAGKSTLLRAVVGLVEATHGRVFVCGVDVAADPERALPRIGYMPDLPPVYDHLTVAEFLDVFAAAHLVKRAQRRERGDEVLELTRLTEHRHAFAGELSRGLKQRLFLAKTLVHDPDLLLLDEPASGLDPAARLELRDVLVALGARGKAIVVSSHILSELEGFCTAVGVMQGGALVASGSVAELTAHHADPGRYQLTFVDAPPGLAAILEGEGCEVVRADRDAAEVVVPGGPPGVARLVAGLVRAGVAVAEVRRLDSSLMTAFLRSGAREAS